MCDLHVFPCVELTAGSGTSKSLCSKCLALPPHRHHHHDVSPVRGPLQGLGVLQAGLGIPEGASQVACQRSCLPQAGTGGQGRHKHQTGTQLGSSWSCWPNKGLGSVSESMYWTDPREMGFWLLGA